MAERLRHGQPQDQASWSLWALKGSRHLDEGHTSTKRPLCYRDGTGVLPGGQVNWQPGGLRPTQSPLEHWITSMVQAMPSTPGGKAGEGAGAGGGAGGSAGAVPATWGAQAPSRLARAISAADPASLRAWADGLCGRRTGQAGKIMGA